jgi:uncharacterized membrane protein YfcA
MNIHRAFRPAIYMLLAMIAALLLCVAAQCTELPAAPQPQHVVEHDPGAWAFTTGFTSTLTGAFTKPWIGFAAGSAVAVFGNLQDSNHARQNMVGGIIGSVAGYAIIKTLRNDWHKKGHKQ